jgi:hypothetical protein
MRERGDLAGFTGASNDGATATESVAACICRWLRRQYAIASLPSRAGPRIRPASYDLSTVSDAAAAPRSAATFDFGHPGAVYRESGSLPIKSEAAFPESVHAGDGRMVTTKTPIKAKARSNVRAFDRFDGAGTPAGCSPEGLLVLFGLLLRRRQALEALQKLLLGHALDRDLGIVGVDAGAGRADQRHRIGLRLIHFDEFLQ